MNIGLQPFPATPYARLLKALEAEVRRISLPPNGRILWAAKLRDICHELHSEVRNLSFFSNSGGNQEMLDVSRGEILQKN